MGIVNDYINKVVTKLNEYKYNATKPWLQYYDRMPEHLDYYNGSIYDMVYDAALQYPHNIALEYFNTRITYHEFMRHVDRVAVALKKLDVVENECVTICMPNMPEAIYLIYAVNKIGAICNILHPMLSGEEIAKAMTATNSTVLFVTDVSYGSVKELQVDHLVVCEVSSSMNVFLRTAYNLKNKKNLRYRDNALEWKKFIKKGNYVIDTHVSRSQKSPAVIIYSGGTTGKSKGIILSNLNFNCIATQCEVVCKEARPGNSILSALPIFHGFGLCVCIHVPLALGLKCILIPKIDTKKIPQTIKSKKPNLLPVIPSMLNIIVNSKEPGSTAFQSVKVILSGGDYLSDKLAGEVISYFRRCGSTAHIQIGYGMSEATAFVSATNESVRSIDNIGIPNPDTDIRIFDPAGESECEYGTVGEICVNGPSVMLGYINNDEETAIALRTHRDGKVWLHTGDLGYMDSNGVLHYTSRLKRMIISNGYNIYPVELEEVINKCKYVATSVVVGIRHKIKQEVPKAVIVLKKGVELTSEVEKEIRDYCKKNLARNAMPTEFEFRASLPVTKIGKINYRKLQEEHEKKNKD